MVRISLNSQNGMMRMRFVAPHAAIHCLQAQLRILPSWQIPDASMPGTAFRQSCNSFINYSCPIFIVINHLPHRPALTLGTFTIKMP